MKRLERPLLNCLWGEAIAHHRRAARFLSGNNSMAARQSLLLSARNLFDEYFVAKISHAFADGYLNTLTAEARRTIGVQLAFAIR